MDHPPLDHPPLDDFLADRPPPDRPAPGAPWAPGCLSLLLGGLAGYGADRLSRAAREECNVILREHPGLFDWWTWSAPLTVIAAAFTGLIAWGLPAALLRWTGRRGRRREAWQRGAWRLAPWAVFAGALAALALWHFAWLGTPAAGGNDPDRGRCAVGNVPPWWPDRLPS
ncbi:hypothetical protein [Streptomyces katsurahamanus]|uniref:Integral membrane protein n=1 Tax=Streptomyces katsurahamanus TaxID=2577098 RepID=A0ABW9NSN0_9ACTN|nr:hypothetical protein [Streptomyces katsurahamanus]MQS36320.1 hypothetical protein [Streptomyces katsurahamanus]